MTRPFAACRLIAASGRFELGQISGFQSRYQLRPREHLTECEIDKLIVAAKGNRWGLRDATMILIAFRHGLRVSELCGLQWSDVEFETATLHLRRAKRGAMATHPVLGDELRALRALKRESKSPFVGAADAGGMALYHLPRQL